jgi:photosystem II stability/assembly factor-like uncharacterized protein
MADESVLNGSMGAIWVQPDGPNSISHYLGCYEMGDLPIPKGAITRTLCPDPSQPGKWVVKSRRQGPPDAPTTTITGLTEATESYVENLSCPFSLYVKQSECDRKDVFTSYQRMTVLKWVIDTQEIYANMAQREGADDSTHAVDLDIEGVDRCFPLEAQRRTTTEANALNDVAACGVDRCQGACGVQQAKCDTLYAVAVAGGTGVKAKVLKSTDAGVVWAATTADPFAVGESIAAVVCFPMTSSITRVIVACGTTGAATHAHIAYSDDGGVTWTNVDVNTLDAEFFVDGGSLEALDRNHIWGVTDQGNIFFSSDAGVTWTEQTSTNANSLSVVRFANKDVGMCAGATNTLMTTNDGGLHWTVETAPAAGAGLEIRSGWIFDSNRLWLVYATGLLYYTLNGGATFTARTGLPLTPSVLNDLNFWDEYVGFLGGRVATGGSNYLTVFRTIDGGYNWEEYRASVALDGATNGANALAVCGVNQAFAVGTVSTTASIYEIAV